MKAKVKRFIQQLKHSPMAALPKGHRWRKETAITLKKARRGVVSKSWRGLPPPSIRK